MISARYSRWALVILMLATLPLAGGCGRHYGNLWPMAVGNFWQYRTNLMDPSGHPIKAMRKVAGVERVGDADCMVVQVFYGASGTPQGMEYYAWRDNTLTQYRRDRVEPNLTLRPSIMIPPMPILKNGTDGIQNWTWEGRSGPYSAKFTMAMTGVDKVRVGEKGAEKEYDAVKVRVDGTIQGGTNAHYTYWFVDGIGPVKIIEEASYGAEKFAPVMELENYNVQK